MCPPDHICTRIRQNFYGCIATGEKIRILPTSTSNFYPGLVLDGNEFSSIGEFVRHQTFLDLERAYGENGFSQLIQNLGENKPE